MKLPPVERKICGEYRGWNAHNRYGEEVCGPCKTAHARYARERRHRNGESKSTLYTAAQIEAIKQQAVDQALRSIHTKQLPRHARLLMAGRKQK
jgi:hypothetical protein